MRRLRTPLALALWLLWAYPTFAAAPDWVVDPTAYELSATMALTLSVDHEPVAGPDNRLAAFANGELRGVALPVKVLDRWVFFLTVYADQSGDTLTFKAYVSADDLLLDAEETLVFRPNARYGSAGDSLPLNALHNYDSPPALRAIADQRIELGQAFAPVDLRAHLQSADGDPVRYGVSGPGFRRPRLSVVVSPDDLVSVSPPHQYWVGTDTLVFTAVEETGNRLTAVAQATFTIRPPDHPPGLRAIPDQTIRQQRAFAPFDLDDFLIELDADAVAWTLAFPSPGATTGPPVYTWSVPNSSAYESSMAVTADISLHGQRPAAGANRLAAFAADPSRPGGLGELRGMATSVSMGERELFFLTVFANQAGEQILFRYFDAANGQVYPVATSLSFTANAAHGDPQTPLELRAGVLAYSLDEEHVVRVEVLDPAWTGEETVRLTATDQGTSRQLSSSAEVSFRVDPAQTRLGDVNGDDQVTALDAEWIMEHVVGARVLGPVDAALADVNGDGRISAFDVRLVLQYAAGLTSGFPTEANGGH